LKFDNNATGVQIGSASPLICNGNRILGNLAADNNSGFVLIFGNSVAGNAQVLNNTNVVDVVSNVVGGNLKCLNNPQLIMGGDNTAAKKQGQCN
jgi:hypothetical protein